MKNLFIGFLIMALLNSCVVKSPIGNVTQYNEKNKTFVVYGPGYVTKVSKAGYGLQIISGGAGGAAGMMLQPSVFYDSKGANTNQALNIAIGTAVGYGISSLLTQLRGKGKTTGVNYDDEKKFDAWLRKYNRKNGTDYLSAREGNIVISRSSESTFKPKDIADLKMYFRVFPDSKRYDEMALLMAKHANRDEILELSQTVFAGKVMDSTAQLLKKTIVEKSNSVVLLHDAAKKFPEYRDYAEELAVKQIQSLNDAKSFIELFPNSKYNDDIFLHLSGKLSRDDLKSLIALFPENKNIEKAKLRFVAESPDYTSFIASLKTYSFSEFRIFENSNLKDGEKFIKDLNKVRSFIGASNADRIANSMKDDYAAWIKSRYTLNSEADCQKLRKELDKNSWLGDRRNDAYASINKRTSELANIAAENARRAEFEAAKRGGVKSLLAYKKKNPNAPELAEVAELLNKFVQENVVVAEHDYWVSKGDASFGSELAESSRNMGFQGGALYNLFGIGRVKNKSNEMLPVKVTFSYNVLNTKRLIIPITERHQLHTFYYTFIRPGETETFLTLFKNFSEGGSLGSGIFVIGSTSTLDFKNPYNIKVEFLTEQISTDIFNQQLNLFNEVAKNNGNVKVEKSNQEKNNEFVEGALQSFFGSDYKIENKDEILVYVDNAVNYERVFILNGQERKVSANNTETLKFSVTQGNSYGLQIGKSTPALYNLKAESRKTHYRLEKTGLKFLYKE